MAVNPYKTLIFLVKSMETKGFFILKSSKMSQLVSSDLFEHLYYGSTAIVNMFTLTAQGPAILVVRI